MENELINALKPELKARLRDTQTDPELMKEVRAAITDLLKKRTVTEVVGSALRNSFIVIRDFVRADLRKKMRVSIDPALLAFLEAPQDK